LEKYKLGRSNIEVSRLALGCWPLGGGSGWGDQSESSAIATIHAALDHGINFVDSAEGYENGASEEVIGKALADRRDRAIIGTKVSPNHTEPLMLRRYFEDALRRLQTDYIDVYHVHWPIRTHPVAGTFEVLQQLKDEGKIRAIGVSNFGPIDLGEALATGAQIDANQIPYSLVFRAIEYEMLSGCVENQVGVTTYMPLMQGLLTGKYATADDVPPFRSRTKHFSSQRPQARHGGPGLEKELFETVDAVRAIAQDLGKPMANVALAWVLAKPGVTSVLTGARTPDQVAQNVQAVSLSLSPEAIARLDAATDPLKQLLGPNADPWQIGDNSRVR